MIKFIFCLPYSEFIDAYEHKAINAISVGFRDIVNIVYLNEKIKKCYKSCKIS